MPNGKIASKNHASNDTQGYRHEGWRYEEDGYCDRLEMGDSQTNGQGAYGFVAQPSPRSNQRLLVANREEQEVPDPRRERWCVVLSASE